MTKLKLKQASPRKAPFFKHFYMAEFNRGLGDNINNVVRKLRRKGYDAIKLGHKTTIIIRRPSDVRFRVMKDDLSELAQNRIGGIILSSTSGKMWRLDNRGNRPGIFQPITLADFD